VNDEFVRVWKEAIVSCFNAFSWDLAGETEVNKTNICQNRRHPKRDLR
jgi:hypothetical protein